MRVIVQEKLSVGFGQLVPMLLGADNSEDQDTTTVNNQNEEPVDNLKKTFWWKYENWPKLKNFLDRLRKLTVHGVCYLGYLELGKDPVPQIKCPIF